MRIGKYNIAGIFSENSKTLSKSAHDFCVGKRVDDKIMLSNGREIKYIDKKGTIKTLFRLIGEFFRGYWHQGFKKVVTNVLFKEYAQLSGRETVSLLTKIDKYNVKHERKIHVISVDQIMMHWAIVGNKIEPSNSEKFNTLMDLYKKTSLYDEKKMKELDDLIDPTPHRNYSKALIKIILSVQKSLIKK